MVQRPYLEREEREAQEPDERHLEDLETFEKRHRINPAAARHRVERLPQHTGEQAGGHQARDSAPAASRDVPEQRPFGVARVQMKLSHEPYSAPCERVEESRKGERRDEQAQAGPARDPQARRVEDDRVPTQVPPDSQTVQYAFAEQDRGDDCGERDGDPDPARETARGQEHVVPVLETEVERLEHKPDHRRPPQHQDEIARASEQRLSAEQHHRLVEDDERGIPAEHVEPRGEGRDLVGQEHGGGDQRDHRRRQSHPGSRDSVALRAPRLPVQARSFSSWRPNSMIVSTQMAASASVERKLVTQPRSKNVPSSVVPETNIRPSRCVRSSSVRLNALPSPRRGTYRTQKQLKSDATGTSSCSSRAASRVISRATAISLRHSSRYRS